MEAREAKPNHTSKFEVSTRHCIYHINSHFFAKTSHVTKPKVSRTGVYDLVMRGIVVLHHHTLLKNSIPVRISNIYAVDKAIEGVISHR